MDRRVLCIFATAFSLYNFGGGSAAKADDTVVKVPVLINIVKGTIRQDDQDVVHPTKEDLKKRISEAMKGAGEILTGAGVELAFDPDKDIQEVENPDGSKMPEMNGKYDKEDLDKVDKAADAELRKKFGGPPTKGFKIYLTFAIKNLPVGENGVSYVSLKPPSPGFSIIEPGELEGRLLAHELGHGLGCLDDTERKGALMNPKGTRDDKNLTDEEKTKLKACAKERAK